MSQLGTPEHWVATELSSVVKIIDCTLLRILICNVFICSLYFSNLCIFLLSLHLSQFYELVLREINLIDRCVTNFVPRHTGAVKPKSTRCSSAEPPLTKQIAVSVIS